MFLYKCISNDFTVEMHHELFFCRNKQKIRWKKKIVSVQELMKVLLAE